MLLFAYLAALVIGFAVFRSGPEHSLARAVALVVGLGGTATGAALTVDARAEGHALDELGLPLLLAAGGLLLAAGAALWHGPAGHALRVAGVGLGVVAMGVPSTLTLALPIAALTAGNLRPAQDAVRAVR